MDTLNTEDVMSCKLGQWHLTNDKRRYFVTEEKGKTNRIHVEFKKDNHSQPKSKNEGLKHSSSLSTKIEAESSNAHKVNYENVGSQLERSEMTSIALDGKERRKKNIVQTNDKNGTVTLVKNHPQLFVWLIGFLLVALLILVSCSLSSPGQLGKNFRDSKKDSAQLKTYVMEPKVHETTKSFLTRMKDFFTNASNFGYKGNKLKSATAKEILIQNTHSFVPPRNAEEAGSGWTTKRAAAVEELIVQPGPTHEFIPPKNVEDVGSGWSTRDRSSYDQIIIDENTEFRNWKNQAVAIEPPVELKNGPQTHWSNFIVRKAKNTAASIRTVIQNLTNILKASTQRTAIKEKTESSKDKDILSLNSIGSVSNDIVEPNDTNTEFVPPKNEEGVGSGWTTYNA